MNKTLRNLALVALVAAPFSAFAEIAGSGTAEDPYVIASKEDLCNAWTKTVNKGTVYFIQTADIDMTGQTDYHAITGWNGDTGTYGMTIHYDGRNHVISNFAPTQEYPSDGQHAYCSSVFGVPSGSIKNLGVVDANCDAGSHYGAGIIGAYGGHSQGGDLLLENVYVTGEVAGTYGYVGGMIGTAGANVTMKNCFANVKLSGSSLLGGLMGRSAKVVTFENCYAAASTSPAIASAKSAATIKATNVVAFGETAVDANITVDGTITIANTTAGVEEAIAAIKAWPAFSATETVTYNNQTYPALEYAFSGTGTENDPYIIDSKEALCNAWRNVDTYIEGTEVWFKQTADIDMEGVNKYTTISGWRGGNTAGGGNAYYAVIHYDGQNHIIKNFAPESAPADAVNNTYYCTSIFGVPAGSIKNLGVINANIETTQGAGILGAYAGHSSATGLTVENVFVEGQVSGTGDYTGAMFGTTGKEVTIKNCFANVAVAGATGYTGGLIGRLRNTTSVTMAYVAGSVEGADNKVALVASTDKTGIAFNATNFIAFNTGATAALSNGITLAQGSAITVATDETKTSLIEDVQTWRGGAFSEDKYLEGYPILADFEEYGTSGIFEAAVEVEAEGPAVYYNLQGVQVANPDNGIYIVRRGNKVTKELIRK